MDEHHVAMLDRAAAAVAAADALLITAGAGIGVDSGLPDFRGNEGFWRAYPPLERLGISFVDMANPSWFEREPALAWGFYGHRLNLYRATVPHAGFQLLRRFSDTTPIGAFVFTSNVDGQFQRAGFAHDAILECHGSIHHMQCSSPCSFEIWDGDDVRLDVDEDSFRAAEPLPRCPRCGGLARPNVLMFGDYGWVPNRTSMQERRFAQWMDRVAGRSLTVIELGAGTAVPTVRMTSERAAQRAGGTLIRINTREAHGPRGHIGIAGQALATLQAIDERLEGR